MRTDSGTETYINTEGATADNSIKACVRACSSVAATVRAPQQGVRALLEDIRPPPDQPAAPPVRALTPVAALSDAMERPCVVITQRDGCNRWVLLNPQTRSPFWSVPVSDSPRLPRDPALRAAEVKGAVESTLASIPAALGRLEGYVIADPHGHSSLQPRGPVSEKLDRFPPGEAVSSSFWSATTLPCVGYTQIKTQRAPGQHQGCKGGI